MDMNENSLEMLFQQMAIEFAAGKPVRAC